MFLSTFKNPDAFTVGNGDQRTAVSHSVERSIQLRESSIAIFAGGSFVTIFSILQFRTKKARSAVLAVYMFSKIREGTWILARNQVLRKAYTVPTVGLVG